MKRPKELLIDLPVDKNLSQISAYLRRNHFISTDD